MYYHTIPQNLLKMTNCISTMDKFKHLKTIQFYVLYFVGKNQGILTMLIFLEKSINLEGYNYEIK